MAEAEAPKEASEAKGWVRNTLMGLLKHLGVPAGVVTILITFGMNWFEGKQEEYRQMQKDIRALIEKQKIMEAKAATDGAQWRSIRNLSYEVTENKVTARTNERIIDRVLMQEETSEESQIENDIPRFKHKPQEVEEFKHDMEQQHIQEQRK